MKFLYKLGSYLIFIRKAFSRPEKRSVYTKEVIVEFEKLGLNSIVLVVIISFFIGAVLTLQTAYNMQSPLLPRYLIGYLFDPRDIIVGIFFDDREFNSGRENWE